jgi:hypothetical protein
MDPGNIIMLWYPARPPDLKIRALRYYGNDLNLLTISFGNPKDGQLKITQISQNCHKKPRMKSSS